MQNSEPAFIRFNRLAKVVGLSRVQLLYAAHKGKIPKPKKLGLFANSPLAYTKDEANEIIKTVAPFINSEF